MFMNCAEMKERFHEINVARQKMTITPDDFFKKRCLDLKTCMKRKDVPAFLRGHQNKAQDDKWKAVDDTGKRHLFRVYKLECWRYCTDSFAIQLRYGYDFDLCRQYFVTSLSPNTRQNV